MGLTLLQRLGRIEENSRDVASERRDALEGATDGERVASPARCGPRKLYLAQQRHGEQVQELVSVTHVPVEGRRLHLQSVSKRPHRQSIEPVLLNQVKGSRDYPCTSQPGLPFLIATWYAKNTKGDIRNYQACAQSVVDRLSPGSSVLEVAPGPGYLAIEIAKRGDYRVVGMDISHSFVRIASENARLAGVDIDFHQGDAAHMPFPSESFDFVVCRAAFKNFSDPVGALDEIHRVLKPGGKASIYDLRKDASLEEIEAEVRGMGLSWLNALLTRWTFRHMLLKNAYSSAALERMLSASRFGTGQILRDGIGFDLRLAK